MSKKDYELIARALQAARPDTYSNAIVQWFVDVEALARMLQADNPEFNRIKFLAACES